jgi:serine/threonine protein kinase
MGSVYEAEDLLLQRRVAMKVLSVASAKSANRLADLQRFVAEARAAARCSHPNVVAIHDVDVRDDTYFIVMELVRGGTASDFVKANGPFPWAEATRMVADTCRGLAAAHAAGLVHRDIKPGNIMRGLDGSVKLADFGLAHGAGGRAGSVAEGVAGTPQYMSPEQCRAQTLDGRSDVYSLGATYFALMTGRSPFGHYDDVERIMQAHLAEPCPDPRAEVPGIPEACVGVIRKAMAKHPNARYQTATEMAAELDAILASLAGSDSARQAAAGAGAVAAGPVVVVAEPASLVVPPVQSSLSVDSDLAASSSTAPSLPAAPAARSPARPVVAAEAGESSAMLPIAASASGGKPSPTSVTGEINALVSAVKIRPAATGRLRGSGQRRGGPGLLPLLLAILAVAAVAGLIMLANRNPAGPGNPGGPGGPGGQPPSGPSGGGNSGGAGGTAASAASASATPDTGAGEGDAPDPGPQTVGTDPVKVWAVIGPFAADGAEDTGRSHPPEREIDLAKTYPGKGDTVGWKPAEWGPASVDLNRNVGKVENCCAYAATQLVCPIDTDAVLLIGSDDSCKMWLNGRMVHEFKGNRGFVADSDTVEVRLRKGVNNLLVKVVQGNGGWEFGVRVLTRSDTAITGLVARLPEGRIVRRPRR